MFGSLPQKKEMISNFPQKYPEIPRNTRKYPRVKKIPENTRSYILTLLPDPNPTRYPVFFLIPDPTRYWKTLPVGHWLSLISHIIPHVTHKGWTYFSSTPRIQAIPPQAWVASCLKGIHLWNHGMVENLGWLGNAFQDLLWLFPTWGLLNPITLCQFTNQYLASAIWRKWPKTPVHFRSLP